MSFPSDCISAYFNIFINKCYVELNAYMTTRDVKEEEEEGLFYNLNIVGEDKELPQVKTPNIFPASENLDDDDGVVVVMWTSTRLGKYQGQQRNFNQ
jgi:hypothetical protein